MSFISTIHWSQECGLLGELEFRIEFEYEPELGIWAEDFDITGVQVCVEDKWVTLSYGNWDFSKDQYEHIKQKCRDEYYDRMAEDQYLNSRCDRDEEFA